MNRRMQLASGLALMVTLALSMVMNTKPARAITCIGTPIGTALFYNPASVPSGAYDATGCDYGIVLLNSPTSLTVNSVTIYGAGRYGVYASNSVVTVKDSVIKNNANGLYDYQSKVYLSNTSVNYNTADGVDDVGGYVQAANQSQIELNGKTGLSANGNVDVSASAIKGNQFGVDLTSYPVNLYSFAVLCSNTALNIRLLPPGTGTVTSPDGTAYICTP